MRSSPGSSPAASVPTEVVAHVDDRALQAGQAEQAGLRRAVRLERAVIVEMVAGEVGEHGRVEAHRRHALLVERVRRHLEGDALRPGIAGLGEAAVHAHHVGRGQSGVAQCARPAEAERAEIRATPADEVGGLCEQVGAGGLAVGAGEARDTEVGGGTLEEAVGEFAGQCAQARDRLHDDLWRQQRRLDAGRRLPQHRGGAVRDRRGNMREAVSGAARAREECRTRCDVPAVEREPAHGDVARRRSDAVE